MWSRPLGVSRVVLDGMDVRREFAAVRDLDDPERETWGVSGAAPKLDVAEMLTTREDDDGGPCAGSAQGRRLPLGIGRQCGRAGGCTTRVKVGAGSGRAGARQPTARGG